MVYVYIAGWVLEKYYQANARALSLNKIILPASHKPSTFIFAGNHDFMFDIGRRKTP